MLPFQNIHKIFLLIWVSISIISCSSPKEVPNVKDGFIDVSEVDFNTVKKVPLNGEWHFYWQQFPYKESQFSTQILKTPSLIELPGNWIGNYFAGNKYPAKGYATYRLKIRLGESLVPLSLKIPRSYTAAEIWINGQKIEQLGDIGVQSDAATPSGRPLLVDLPKASEIDLLIPISNYEYRAGGGFIQGITIGNRKFLRAERERQLLIESLSVAAVLVVAVFSILFYYVESRRIVFLYFGIFVICGALRQIVVGESILLSMFPETPFWLIHRLRLVPFYFGMGIAGLYFYTLFPKEFSKHIVKLYFWISMAFAIYLVLAPTYISSYAFIPYQFIAFFGIGYAVLSITKAAFRKRSEAKFVLFAMGVMGLVMVNDLLVVQQFIDSIFLMNYGFVAFIGMQVIVLFRTYKSYTEQIDQLSEDLSTAGEQIQYQKDDIDILATDNAMRLQYKKQVLQQLKDIQKLDHTQIGSSVRKLSQEIRSQIQVEEKLSFQQEHIDLLNTKFNKRLLEKYPNLSKTEQEICGLIRLKLSTKEIAAYRNTSDGAIRVAKNRIRKKINIIDQDDLENLMLNI
ncbi:7TM diverse intracellular signaling domain-containing protein [Aquimarina sp. MMG016]|uniref:7TM diverse intracellular signaling domain-containing protein n=1 Tax=Aquimarina sp. MMG016 TaxID=2822690 RepID=UPI001B3A22E0|nr:7TM diverse intracellular signaling domain-containing protein [Aquimarina sp. MMG016]